MNNAAKTINGKELDTVLCELRRPFEPEEFSKENGYTILSYDVIKRRFDEVIGIAHYTLQVIEVTCQNIQNSHILLGNANLKIYYDDGTLAREEKYPCGASIIVTKQGNCLNFSNDTEFLYQNALKKGSKIFCVGTEQLAKYRAVKKNKKENVQNSPATNNLPTLLRYNVHILETFKPLGKNGYHALVTVDELGAQRMLCIFKEGIKAIEKAMSIEEFVQRIKINSSFHIVGFEKTYNGKRQLILHDIEIKK